jgi:diguanylate cyclase (GGDEF)-like protein
LIGATTIDLRLEGLEAFIAEQTKDEKTYAFIVDQHNRFITYPRNSIIVDKDGENRLTINQLKDQFPAFKPLAEALEFVRSEEIGLALNHSIRSVAIAAELDQQSYQVDRDQANMMATALNNPHRDNFGTALSHIEISHDLLFGAAATAHVFNVPDAYWKVVVVSHKDSAFAAVKEIIVYSMLTALIPLSIVMLIAFFGMRKVLIEPLQQFTTILQGASNGKTGDDVLLDDSRNDELGNLAYWYNRRTKDLSETLSELSTVNNELSYQANFDHLTSLINRRQFERRLQSLIDSEDWAESSLFYLDLDQFKVVNDTCGHLAGDQLLIQVSESLSAMLSPGDLIARIGGDEFAFISRVSNRDDAASYASKILAVVNGVQFDWEGRSFPVSGSIGVILLKDIEPSAGTAMRYVDNSCYAAKDNGRNGWHMYEPETGLIEQREGEMNQLAQINAALENDSFFSVFQIIWPTDPSGNTRAGLEALIRLRTEDGKLIPPSSFLPAAERYNAIINIDRWMINHTLGELAENRHVLDSIRFCSINLSASFICNDGMLSYIADKLIHHGIPAGKICFEITENQIMVSLAQAKTGLKALRQLGCQVALDDFGTGMSSYSYLQQLPIDHLKIDGHFVKNITQDKVQKTFVQSIRDIGAIMEIETIAEFVEDEQTYLMLRDIGVTYAQGYGVARPLDIASVAKLLESGELNEIGKNVERGIPPSLS